MVVKTFDEHVIYPYYLGQGVNSIYIPALTLPFSSVFFDSFSITLLYSKKSPKLELKLNKNRFSSPLLGYLRP